MFCALIFIIGFVTADTPNDLVAMAWTTHSDGTIYFAPKDSSTTFTSSTLRDTRLPAAEQQSAQELSATSHIEQTPESMVLFKAPYQNKYPGLGKYSCIKRGFLDAGAGDVSNKYIAMITVRAKDKYDGAQKINETQILAESIFTLSTVGACKSSDYRFTPTEAQRSEEWLNSQRVNVTPADYQFVFQMDRGRVGAAMANYDNNPTRIKRNWDYWNQGTTPHTCAQSLETSKRIRLCKIMARACNAQNVGCDDKSSLKISSALDLKSSSSSAALANDLSSTATGPTTDEDLERTPSATNESNGHGRDNSGGHGEGPR